MTSAFIQKYGTPEEKDFLLLAMVNHSDINKSLKEKITVDIKKRLRASYRSWLFNHEADWRVRRPEDYDRRYKKIVLPYVLSDSEIVTYIKDNTEYWYNPYEDGRDCTGVWFTSDIEVFSLPKVNKTIIYHFQSCDV